MSQQKKIWIADRFEASIAVLENTVTLERVEVDKNELPEGAREGDAFYFGRDGWKPDPETTRIRGEDVRKRFNSLIKRKT